MSGQVLDLRAVESGGRTVVSREGEVQEDCVLCKGTLAGNW